MQQIKKITTIALMFLTTLSFACSCAFEDELSLSDLLRMDYVFEGKVLNVEMTNKKNDSSFEFHRKKITLSVLNLYKGQDIRETVEIYTASDGAACGVGFNTGETWIVWAYMNDNKISTDICTPSSLMSRQRATKQIPLLKKYKKKNSKQSFQWKSKTGMCRGTGEMTYGKPQGHWSHYFANGQIKSTGYYINGEKSGIWKYYHSKETSESIYERLFKEHSQTSISKTPDEGLVYKMVLYDRGKRVETKFAWPN